MQDPPAKLVGAPTHALSTQHSVLSTHRDQARQADLTPYLPGLRRWARTAGGEWHGPCPRCGGTDRLLAWPAHPRGPRALCRQCHPQAMDPIALVQWLGLARDFPAAVALLAGSAPRLAPPLPMPLPAVGQAAGLDCRPYRPPPAGQRVVARYSYYAPAAPLPPQLLYQKERREPGFHGKPKTFYLRHPRPEVAAPRPDDPAAWLEGAGTRDRFPYNWPAVLAAPAGAPVLWVDGEKDVRTARAAGLLALCAPDGGATWQEPWGILFYQHPALVIPDQEPGGLATAAHVAALLAPYADSVRLVPLPAKDFTAWCLARRTTDEGVSHGL